MPVDAEAPAAESSPASETPEAATPDAGIFPVEKVAPKPQSEELAPPKEEEKPESEEDESAQAPEAAKQERPEEESKAEKRIKKLTAQVYEMRRMLQQNPVNKDPGIMAPPVRPKLEEFEDIAKYDDALEKWKDEDRKFAVQQDRIAREREAREQQMAKQQQELRADWDKRSQRVLKQNPEFNVTEALQRVEPSPTMDGFFADSEVGPELLVYLDENPDEADRIRELAPFKAVRALVKLEDELSNQVKGIKAKPSFIKPPAQTAGRASAPAAPKTAADILYG